MKILYKKVKSYFFGLCVILLFVLAFAANVLAALEINTPEKAAYVFSRNPVDLVSN